MNYSRANQIRQAHLRTAKIYSDLSRAKRLKVGAVLVCDDRPISVGYNGTPSGMSNECETGTKVNGDLETKPEVVHAEMNVIAFAAKQGVPTEGCTMYITTSPCFECSKLIVQSGIKNVFYEKEYRVTDGIMFLRSCGVSINKVEI